MTRAEAARLVAALLAIYPHATVSSATGAAYERQLADLDYVSASRAVARLTNTSKFLPTIAEIRAATLEITHGPRRLGAEAWGDVAEQIRRAGSYRRPRFTDPLVGEAVRMLGWIRLCRSDNEAADRARFVELYEGLQERARLDAVSGVPLPPARGYGRLAPLGGQSATGPTRIAGALPARGGAR